MLVTSTSFLKMPLTLIINQIIYLLINKVCNIQQVSIKNKFKQVLHLARCIQHRHRDNRQSNDGLTHPLPLESPWRSSLTSTWPQRAMARISQASTGSKSPSHTLWPCLQTKITNKRHGLHSWKGTNNNNSQIQRSRSKTHMRWWFCRSSLDVAEGTVRLSRKWAMSPNLIFIRHMSWLV